MNRKNREEYNEALSELVETLRTEREMNGEDPNEPIVVPSDRAEEVMQAKYNELHGISDTEEFNMVGNKICLVIILVSLIVFFVAMFANIENLIGFALAGVFLAPACMTTVEKGKGAFKIRRKAKLKDRIFFIIVGGFLLYGAVAQVLKR